MSSKKLFLSFISDWNINYQEIRSFLEYFKNSDLPFQIFDFPSNLYKTSENLTKNALNFTIKWKLPNDISLNVVVSLIASEDNLNILNFELGKTQAIDYFIGNKAREDNIIWLTDLMRSGGKIIGAKCVQLSLEEETNRTIKAKLKDGFLYLERIPLILWTSAFLSPQIETLKDNFWRTEFQWDGAWLLIPNQLPSEDYDRSTSSVWIEEGEIMRYFLVPDNLIIPSGNTKVHNIEDRSILVENEIISRFEVSEETAKLHAQSKMQNAVARSLKIFLDLIVDYQKSNLENSSHSEARQEEILLALLGITKEEGQNNPEAVKYGFIKSIEQFKEIISSGVSDDKKRLEMANLKAKEIDLILKKQGIDTKGILDIFPDNLHNLSSQHNKNFQPFIEKIDSICYQLKSDPNNLKKENLDEIIKCIKESYRNLFDGENSEKIQAEQQQEYRKIIKQNIERAREKHPLPSLNFEDLWPED
ncbi:MAG: hypothetical protein ACFBSE_25460 [Prochloraceae cyanobacterium]